jgi:uncharacterized protein YndB with AHSA1/START domain
MKKVGALTVTLPSDREVVLTRVLDAPRKLVYEAMNDSELIKRWLLGPPGWTMTECEIDARVGGKFRHVWSGPGGMAMAMTGVYREIIPAERVVRTECFEFGCEPQMGEQLATMTLAEQGGKTTVTITVLYPSKEARDATIASGMAEGVSATYDRLAELLASRRAA